MTTPAASGPHLGQSLHNPALSLHNITIPSSNSLTVFGLFNYRSLSVIGLRPCRPHWSLLELTPTAGAAKGFQ